MNQEGKTPAGAVESAALSSFFNGTVDSCKITINVTNINENYGPLITPALPTECDLMDVDDIVIPVEEEKDDAKVPEPESEETDEDETDSEDDDEDSEDDEDFDSDDSDADYY